MMLQQSCPHGPRLRVVVGCHACGIVRIPAHRLSLRLAVIDGSTSYRFRCLHCGSVTVAPMDRYDADGAVTAGARREVRLFRADEYETRWTDGFDDEAA